MSETLPGQLAYIFIVSIIDAAILSWVALRWYRRRVRHLMAGGARPAQPPMTPGAQSPPRESIEFARFDPVSASERATTTVARPHGIRRLALAYCIGAAAYAAVIAALTLAPEAGTLPPAAWAAQWWMHTWPVVPSLAVLLVLDRRAIFRFIGIYVVAGMVVVAATTLVGQLLRGTLNSAPMTNVYWMLVGLAWNAWAPLLLLLITGWRRVRAVLPLTLAATLVFGFSTLFFNELLIRAFNSDAVRAALLDLAVALSASAAYYVLFMLVSLPVGWLAWRLVRRLAGAFERKRFSDVQLIVDCWWIVVTAEVVSTSLSTMYGAAGMLGGLAAFAAYRISVALTLRHTEPHDTPKRLLLLRVFGYEGRTESLFDLVAQRWRFHGAVQLIAGVDLAMRTADPGDILAFVNGRLADNYIRSTNEIAHRIGSLDLRTDPDSRFRINELYCRADTWQPTLQALLDVTDVVLMDLRSFRKENAGCIFELEQVTRRVATDHVVLVYDDTTDLPLLGRILASARDTARADGLLQRDGAIPLVKMQGHSPRELSLLMARLLG